MTRPPDLQELLGEELDPRELERLRRVHDQLVIAGPPAELPPHLEGPNLAMTLGRPLHRRVTRRAALLAAAAIVILCAFLAGYITGNDNGPSGRALTLRGTALAPKAEGKLRLETPDPAGNWPMTLAVRGLPKLPARGYYEVFLVRKGRIFAPCGGFIVKNATEPVSVQLNAPYRFKPGDSWVVTRQIPGANEAGPVVLTPIT